MQEVLHGHPSVYRLHVGIITQSKSPLDRASVVSESAPDSPLCRNLGSSFGGGPGWTGPEFGLGENDNWMLPTTNLVRANILYIRPEGSNLSKTCSLGGVEESLTLIDICQVVGLVFVSCLRCIMQYGTRERTVMLFHVFQPGLKIRLKKQALKFPTIFRGWYHTAEFAWGSTLIAVSGVHNSSFFI